MDLNEALCKQIEYYLSEENLQKDAFLLSHMAPFEHHSVLIDLFLTFKRVKAIFAEHQTEPRVELLAEALASSKNVKMVIKSTGDQHVRPNPRVQASLDARSFILKNISQSDFTINSFVQHFNPQLGSGILVVRPSPKHSMEWILQYADRTTCTDAMARFSAFWLKNNNNAASLKATKLEAISLQYSSFDFPFDIH